MKDSNAIDKIVSAQKELFPILDKLDERGILTSDVYEAMQEARQWDEQVEEHNRDGEPRRWQPHKLAHLLHKHIADYPKDVKQKIREYCYIVEKMDYDADRKL